MLLGGIFIARRYGSEDRVMFAARLLLSASDLPELRAAGNHNLSLERVECAGETPIACRLGNLGMKLCAKSDPLFAAAGASIGPAQLFELNDLSACGSKYPRAGTASRRPSRASVCSASRTGVRLIFS
jgi:hypothetical protein